MEKIVKFKNTDTAEKVRQHLYRVDRDGDRLIFSNFLKEQPAFELAVALEGLTRADYFYVSDVCIPPLTTGIRSRMFGAPEILLQFKLQLSDKSRKAFSLAVLSDFIVPSLEGWDEFPLEINISFARMFREIQATNLLDSQGQICSFAIASNLERACLQIERDSCQHLSAPKGYNLIVQGANQSQLIRLNLTDIVLSINRETYE